MIDWQDIRHFLAVAERGTLSGAARALKVDHATVSRRLAALEAALGVRLVDRLPRACRLTAIGRQVRERALAMEAGADGLPRFLGDDDRDLVRIRDGVPAFTRDIWLVVHRDLQKASTVRAVMDFVAAAVGEQRGLSSR